MVVLLLLNMVVGTVMFVLGIRMYTAGSDICLATVLPLLQSALGVALAIAGILKEKGKFGFLIGSTLAIGLLILPVFYAVRYWPGGEDGPGLGYAIIVGGASLLCLPFAVITIVLALVLRRVDRKKRAQNNLASDSTGIASGSKL